MNEQQDKEKGNTDAKGILREGLEYLGELVRVVVISLAIILPVRYFLIQPFYVKGASMEPNFYDREYLVIDEISYRLHAPERGEIIVFRYPRDPSQFFIKRVIGLPGETIHIEGGKIHIINTAHPKGFVMQESYLVPDIFTMTGGGDHVVLGRNEYYLLGDNRPASLDSRTFGPVASDYIIGKVWVRGWPLDRITRFVTPQYGG